MPQTPIQQAISEAIQRTGCGYYSEYSRAMKDMVKILTALLPAEKEEITEAYKRGHLSGRKGEKPNSSDYFTETYKQ